MHEGLDGYEIELATCATGVHKLLEVFVHVFEDEHELVLRVDDIVQGHDILVLQLLHQRDFPYGCRRCALLRVKVDFFQRHELARLAVPSFEDLGRRRSAGLRAIILGVLRSYSCICSLTKLRKGD